MALVTRRRAPQISAPVITPAPVMTRPTPQLRARPNSERAQGGISACALAGQSHARNQIRLWSQPAESVKLTSFCITWEILAKAFVLTLVASFVLLHNFNTAPPPPSPISSPSLNRTKATMRRTRTRRLAGSVPVPGGNGIVTNFIAGQGQQAYIGFCPTRSRR